MLRPETCSVCGEEVRWGWRPGLTSPAPTSGFWMHREAKDHLPILGYIQTDQDRAEIERQLDLPRTRTKPCDPPFPLIFELVPYTTREFDIAKMKKVAREAAEIEEEIAPASIPAPEVFSTPIEYKDPRMPGGAKQILNLCKKHGWTAWATYARGPRVHASQGTLLEISDNVLVRLRLDGSDRRAVASWVSKQGKYAFEFAWTIRADVEKRIYYPDTASFDGLKAWIRGDDESCIT